MAVVLFPERWLKLIGTVALTHRNNGSKCSGLFTSLASNKYTFAIPVSSINFFSFLLIVSYFSSLHLELIKTLIFPSIPVPIFKKSPRLSIIDRNVKYPSRCKGKLISLPYKSPDTTQSRAVPGTTSLIIELSNRHNYRILNISF